MRFSTGRDDYLLLVAGNPAFKPYFIKTVCLFFLAFILPVCVNANQPERLGNTEKKAVPDPLLLLAGIDKANHRASFRGLLTYEANGYINTMRLTQTVIDNKVSQRLNFLDGPKRQVFRQKALSDCNEGAPKWQLWSQNLELDKLSAVYSITTNGVERVADREAYVVSVRPRDNHRYGYRLSIDGETGLLLKALFIVEENVIERLQFSELLLHENEAKQSEDAISDRIATEAGGQPLTVSASQPCKLSEFRSDWDAAWLPKGFVSAGDYLTDHGEQALVFSDGLATLSIFIIDQQESVPKATARYGATVAVIMPLKEAGKKQVVVVVGEIPVATARQVAISVRPKFHSINN